MLVGSWLAPRCSLYKGTRLIIRHSKDDPTLRTSTKGGRQPQEERSGEGRRTSDVEGGFSGECRLSGSVQLNWGPTPPPSTFYRPTLSISPARPCRPCYLLRRYSTQSMMHHEPTSLSQTKPTESPGSYGWLWDSYGTHGIPHPWHVPHASDSRKWDRSSHCRKYIRMKVGFVKFFGNFGA